MTSLALDRATINGLPDAPPTSCYLVGSPRSGTTWLQRLLAAHPAIASGQENDLWDGYIAPWFYKWRVDLPDDPQQWARQRHKGLPAVFTTEDFEATVRGVVDAVNARVHSMKPAASVILDKTPANAKHVQLISRIDPDARYIHIVRDGRDVVASLLNARGGWGKTWAPASAARAASYWAEHVRSAQSAKAGSYLEIRYEDLRSNTAETLASCFRFLDISVTETDLEKLSASQSLPAQRDRPARHEDDVLLWGGEVMRRIGHAPDEPDGFYGEGRSGGWHSWSAHNRLAFDQAAGDLLIALGYEGDRAWLAAHAHDRFLFRLGNRTRAAAAQTRRTLANGRKKL